MLIAKNLDDIVANDDVLSQFVKQLQDMGISAEKSNNGLGTILRLDDTLKGAEREAYKENIKMAMSDMVARTDGKELVLPKLQHARNELLKNSSGEIDKIADGLKGFTELLESSIKDRQDLVRFTEKLGNDAWLHKILTQEAKEELLRRI